MRVELDGESETRIVYITEDLQLLQIRGRSPTWGKPESASAVEGVSHGSSAHML